MDDLNSLQSFDDYVMGDKNAPSTPASDSDVEKVRLSTFGRTGGDASAADAAAQSVQTKEDADHISLSDKQYVADTHLRNYAEAVMQDPTVGSDEAVKILKGLPAAIDTSLNDPHKMAASVYWALGSRMHNAQVKAVQDQLAAEQAASKVLEDAWNDKSTYDLVKDGFSLLVPINWGLQTERMKNVIAQKDNPLGYMTNILAVGEAHNDIIKEMSKMPIEEQLGRLYDLSYYLKANKDKLSGNNFFVFSEVVDKYREAIRGKQEEGTFNRVLDDILGIADAIPVVGAVKAFIRGGGAMSKAGLRMIKKPIADPLAMHASAAGDTDKAADILEKGVESAIAADDVQKVTDTSIRILNTNSINSAVDEAAALGTRPKLLKRLEKLYDKISPSELIELPKPVLLTEQERITAREAEVQRMQNLDGLSTQAIRFDTGAGVDAGGNSRSFKLEATYGAEDGNGFNTLAEAQAAMVKLGDRGKSAKVVAFDRGIQEWKDANSTDMVNGEYYIKYSGQHQYDVLGDQMPSSFADSGLFHPAKFVKGTGYFTSYMKDNGNKINKFFMDAMNVAEDTGGTLRYRLGKVAEPLFKLPHASKGRVIEILEMGSNHQVKDAAGNVIGIGKNYSLSDLLRIDPTLTDKEIEGYFAARTAMDAVDTLKNITLRDRLEREGMKHYSSEHVNTMAKPLTNAKHVQVAYDIERGEAMTLSADDIEQIYAAGGHIAKARTPHRVGKDEYSYLAVRNPAMRKELPARVLNYREGYIHRYYKEKWFVKLEETGIVRDGRTADDAGRGYTHSKTVAAYGTKKEALAHVFDPDTQKLIDEGILTVKTPELDRTLGLVDDGEIAMNQLEGRIFTANRGEHLRGGVNGELARTDDILTSLERDINTTSKLFTHQEVSDVMMERLKGMYPDSVDRVTGALKNTASKEAREAKGIVDFFNGVPTESDKIARSIMIKFSNWLEDRSPALAEYVKDRAGSSVARSLRGLTFGMFIAWNPIKQFALQASQFSMLAAIDPINAIKTVPQSLALHSYFVAKGTKGEAKMIDIAANMAGMSRDEFKAMARAYDDSGLRQSIMNHAMLQNYGALASRVGYAKGFARATQIASNMLRAPTRAASAIGFQAGEKSNLAMSWLLTYNRWKKENPGLELAGNKDAQAMIAAKARQWTLNANRMGTFKFQQGLLSNMTQFWAFQLKALHALTSSPAFTGTQKMRMAVGMGAMWGAAGYGVVGSETWKQVQTAYHRVTGEEFPQTVGEVNVKEMIENGLVHKFFNDMLTAMFGRDDNGQPAMVDFSGQMSPIGGYDIITSFLSKDGTPFEVFAGVSGYSYDNIANAVTFAHNIWRSPLMDSPEKAAKIVQAFARILPLVDQMTRGAMAANLQRHISKSTLTADEKISTGEAVMLALTGFMSQKEVSAIEMRMASSKNYKEQQQVGKDMASVANLLLNQQMDKTGNRLTPEQWQELEQTLQLFTTDMSPQQANEVRKAFNKYVNLMPTEQDAMYKYMTRGFKMEDGYEATATNINGLKYMTNDEKEQLKKVLRVMYENKDMAKEVLNGGE